MIDLLLHSYGEFSPKQPLKSTIWPHFDLLFIHSGSLKLQVEQLGKVSLQTGDGILLFPETKFSPHSRNSKAKASVQHFSLDQSLSKKKNLPPPYNQLINQFKGAIIYRAQKTDTLVHDIERALKWAKLPPSPARDTMRKALLTLILGEFLQIGWEEKPEQGLTQGTDHLLEWAAHQPLPDLSVDALAHAAGVSASTLRREFQKHCGISPKQAIIRLRFNEAKRLLTETAKPIKEIASHIGYRNNITFHTAFKTEFKTTPREYRKKYRVAG